MFEIEILNTAPKFKTALTQEFKIDLIIDEDGNIEDKKPAVFKSPKALDKEGDKMTFKFDLGQGKSYLKATQNSDNSFSLKADRSKMDEKSASFSIKVTLKDSRGKSGSQNQMKVSIKFDDSKY